MSSRGHKLMLHDAEISSSGVYPTYLFCLQRLTHLSRGTERKYCGCYFPYLASYSIHQSNYREISPWGVVQISGNWPISQQMDYSRSWSVIFLCLVVPNDPYAYCLPRKRQQGHHGSQLCSKDRRLLTGPTICVYLFICYPLTIDTSRSRLCSTNRLNFWLQIRLFP